MRLAEKHGVSVALAWGVIFIEYFDDFPDRVDTNLGRDYSLRRSRM